MWYVDFIVGPIDPYACNEGSHLALNNTHTLAVIAVINVRQKPTCKTKGCATGRERNLGPVWTDGHGYPSTNERSTVLPGHLETVRLKHNSAAEVLLSGPAYV